MLFSPFEPPYTVAIRNVEEVNTAISAVTASVEVATASMPTGASSGMIVLASNLGQSSPIGGQTIETKVRQLFLQPLFCLD